MEERLISAGTIGEGDIAGAQSLQQGSQNLLNTAAYLGGSYLGGNKQKPSGWSLNLPIPKFPWS